MKYIYIDKDGRIKMESKAKMNLPNFTVKSVKDSEDLREASCYYKDGKIVKEKNAKAKKDEILAEIEAVDSVESLKAVITKLL